MEEQKVLFYHGETVDGYRFTIAGRFQPMPINGADKEIDVIMLGASLCSAEDMFERREGRIKAEGRMKSNGPKGRNFSNLFDHTRGLNWFEGQEIKVFLERVKLNEALTRVGFKAKFNL